ncbi:MAG TPA: Crp/Fnr family transcriptional regulator [Gemmatimonadaceae bacterium]|jgi:cAMP-binding proteins - catabolite gene activator and regulatory subunit of cAMP-dependent protein kinases
MDTTALLRQLPIFSGLGDEALARLSERCVARTFAAGHLLFTAGEACRGLYIVERGRVRIFRTSPEGREQVLHIEGPGRTVAELPMFDGGPYPASAITIEESRLVFLPRADFEYLYRTHPDVADAVIRSLGARLRHLVQVAETLAFRDVAARLAMLLADYAERSGEATSAGVELTLRRTQEELSLEIGTARESVSRALKQLRRHGLIKTLGRDRILIPDIARLRAMLPAGVRSDGSPRSRASPETQ